MGSCHSSFRGERRRNTTQQASADAAGSADAFKVKGKLHGSGRWKRKSVGGDEDDSDLQLIPGRLFMNGATKTACLYTQQGKKGTNQDAMLVWEDFGSKGKTMFCGVFDGHGPFGHLVARKVRDSLPRILWTQWEACFIDDNSNSQKLEHNNSTTIDSEEVPSLSLDEDLHDSSEGKDIEKFPETFLPLKKSILSAFKLMDKELQLHPGIDCFCSGTTAVTLLKEGNSLVIGNLGDSRAILATRDRDDSLIAVQLTTDLKPDLPAEAARIQQCKGRVFALQDEPEVARLWLPNTDSPGLAMARAFGDFCLKDFGLISTPDVFYRELNERDEFIILATDGIWDVLSNKEAVEVVASAPGRPMAARALVDSAVRAWRLKYPTSKIDDCAAVCLFLEHTVTVSEAEANNDVLNTPTPEPGSQETMAVSEEKTSYNEELSVFHDSQPEKTTAVSEEKTSYNEELSVFHDSQPEKTTAVSEEKTSYNEELSVFHDSQPEKTDNLLRSDEILPVPESTGALVYVKSLEGSKRSLAECISMADDEEWSALKGISRVNSLVSLPRVLFSFSGEKKPGNWRRKWL